VGTKRTLFYGLCVLLVSGGLGALLLEAGMTWRAGLFIMLTIFAALLPAWWLLRRYAHPIHELTTGAQRVAAGEYGHKVYAGGGGELAALARTFNEMSERLADQFAQVEDDRRQLRTVLDGMIEGVVAIDAQQRLLFANDRAAQLLEFHPTMGIGRRLWEIVRHKPSLQLVEKSLATGAPLRDEFDWKGEHTKSLAVYVSPMKGAGGHGAILVLHDTSELRRLERLRHEFVANVSHELKTPLSVIKASVETLIDGAVDDADHRGAFLEQINEQSDRLHNLILDLLSLARIESGQQSLEIERVAIAEAVFNCLERHRARAEANKQTLTALAPDEPSASEIWTDEEALGQILDNLVDNAVKYTPDGSHIRIRWYGCGELICIEVEDNGPGIPERDLPRIFERFYRVDKARSRELGGTGLGLAIVKNLVQILKGSVRVTSISGRGATFIVCLPRTPF
jgi:two-component system phosphate regulon sensor histidine kinase PhoR